MAKHSVSLSASYHQTKMLSLSYQDARQVFLGEGKAFCGWILTGVAWQKFNINGEEIQDAASAI